MNPLLERLSGALSTLELTTVASLLDSHLEQALEQQPSYAEFLCGLLEAEVEARKSRILQARMRMAGLPFAKTLAQFDFSFQPSLDPKQIQELQTLRFAAEARNVILLGPPGVGKTHLAVGLALEALHGGYSVVFVSAHALVTSLGKAAREGKLENKLRYFLKPKVLVVDEVGYLPLDEMGATIFFQLVSARYERSSIILTSNKSYADWGHIFGEMALATAILDRLLHHATTLNIRGESYRLKERRKAGLLPLEKADRKEGISAH